MSAVELSKYHRRDCPSPDGDVYDARCGEVFITRSRKLFFHCSLCDNKYGDFDSFFEHLVTHYEKVLDESNNMDLESYKIEIETQHSSDSYIPDPSYQLENCGEVKYDQSSDNSNTLEGVLETELIDTDEQLANVNDSAALDEVLYDYNQLQSEEEDNSFTKIKVYHCVQCKKLFNNRKHLSRHYLTHSEERKHKCPICGSAFKEKSNFNAHVRRHSGNKKIGCDFCSKKFYTRTEKILHMRSHTHEKPYICSHCGISFSTSSALSTHTKRHTEEPDFRCSYCNKGCWKKEELDDHILVHTKEKRFTCPICNAKYPRRKSMLRHLKLHEKS